jgi:ABC-type Mn2+/Zn2+ transport system permease subunit
MFEYFSSEFLFAKAVWASVLIGLLLPVVGRHLILGRRLMLGLAVPQLAMTGIAAVFLAAGLGWGWASGMEDAAKARAGAMLFGLPGLLLIAAPWKRRPQMQESALAVIYLACMAVTNLIMSSDLVGETYLSDLFHGRLLFINDTGLRTLEVALMAGAGTLLLLRTRLLNVEMDADFSQVSGISCGRWALLGTLVQGSIIGIVVGTAGPLVTFGYLVLPVLAASALSRSLRGNLVLASLLGGASALGGFWISYHKDLPLGDTVVATACGVLILAKVLGRILRISH